MYNKKVRVIDRWRDRRNRYLRRNLTITTK